MIFHHRQQGTGLPRQPALRQLGPDRQAQVERQHNQSPPQDLEEHGVDNDAKELKVPDLALDAAALDDIWDGLDRVDTHFWENESFRRYMESRSEAPPAESHLPWWRFWGPG